MRPSALHVRVRRLVLESPGPEGFTPAALGEAVKSAVAAQMEWGAGPAPFEHPRSLAPIAGPIADSIASSLAGLEPSHRTRSDGGHDVSA